MKKLIFILLFFTFSMNIFAQKGKWKKVQKINTIESYQEFLKNYPSSEYYDEANQELIMLEFNKATSINTINSYKYFLDSYENNMYTKQATGKLINLEFLIAEKENSINSYMEFLSKYPNGEFSEKAKYAISDIDFSRAKSKNNIQGFQEFIKKHPNCSFTNEAIILIMDLEFDEAIKTNTIEAYKLFLEKYPDSEFTEQAKLKLTSLIEEKNAWETVTRNPTLESYFHFVSLKPDSKLKLNNEMLKKVANNARSKGNYFNKTNNKLKFHIDSEDDLVLFSGESTMILNQGMRLYTSPSVSDIKQYNDSGYFIIFYSDNVDPLIIDFYHDKYELNLSYFGGQGYVLIEVRKNMNFKLWDLNN